MKGLKEIKELLNKDWFVAIPSENVDNEILMNSIYTLVGNKDKYIKLVDIEGKVSKTSVILLKKTSYAKKMLKFNKSALDNLIEIIILSNQEVISLRSKTKNKEDKNKLIDNVIKGLNKIAKEREIKEKENLSMYR